MRVFVILLVMIGFVGIVYAHEPKPFPEELDKPPIEIWNESRAILDGTITLKDQSEEWTNYDITINEMFKATTKAKSVTGFVPRNHDWILNEGDRALIYLKSGNEISLYSAKSTNNCTPRDLIQISPVLPNDNSIVRGAPILPWDWKDHCVPHYFTYDPDFWNYMEYKSPLRQYVDHNLPIHMQRCGNDEHVSVIPKSHPYHIACVTESTKLKLVERGWTNMTPIEPDLGKIGTYELQHEGKIFDIKYHIKGGSDIKEIISDDDSNAINIILERDYDGALEITLPRELIDAKISKDVDDLFFVLIDEEEVPYTETTTDATRTLTIQFEKDSKVIEILGAMPL